MRETRNASPAIQSPDRTRRAAPWGRAARSCKGWPAVVIAVAVCIPTIEVATPRQVTTARARFSSRTAASIASISVHLVHHPQLHDRVLVVIDGLVIEPHGDIDPGRTQRHYRRDAVAHVEVAARPDALDY